MRRREPKGKILKRHLLCLATTFQSMPLTLKMFLGRLSIWLKALSVMLSKALSIN